MPKVISIKGQRLPDPPVPADADLRHFRVFSLDIRKLQGSSTWRKGRYAHPAARLAALNLWIAAYHEVPAGSLPNDDEALDGLADVPDWDACKPIAMRGWRLHSDGRLYHETVTQIVHADLEKSRKNAKKGQISAEKRRSEKSNKINAGVNCGSATVNLKEKDKDIEKGVTNGEGSDLLHSEYPNPKGSPPHNPPAKRGGGYPEDFERFWKLATAGLKSDLFRRGTKGPTFGAWKKIPIGDRDRLERAARNRNRWLAWMFYSWNRAGCPANDWRAQTASLEKYWQGWISQGLWEDWEHGYAQVSEARREEFARKQDARERMAKSERGPWG